MHRTKNLLWFWKDVTCQNQNQSGLHCRKFTLFFAIYMSRLPYETRHIAFVVGTISRYMSNPGREHWAVVKWILMYLKGTSRVCLCQKTYARRVYRLGHVKGYRIKLIHLRVHDDLCRESSVVAVTTTKVCGLVDHRGIVLEL